MRAASTGRAVSRKILAAKTGWNWTGHSNYRAPAIASWPRARLTLTREKEEQKPDSATGGCQQKHCSHGKDQHAGSSNEPLEYRGMLDALDFGVFISQ